MFAPIASDRAVAEGARITCGCSGPRPASPEEILSTRRSRGASEGLSAEGPEPSPAEHPAASSNKNAIVPTRTIRDDLTIPNPRGDESFDGEEIDPLMRLSDGFESEVLRSSPDVLARIHRGFIGNSSLHSILSPGGRNRLGKRCCGRGGAPLCKTNKQ